eukprot:CAMPEP_0182915472 /NCGR_PEP_ID=MMETSP0105_2-20130417/348_1 /TAXON_ID=81532 ORGANISM="Acanthoeca-like sp., Strain 10tr" /NCGR_SAMPLE_ID=MMETSP0105_2 /ASSEMBLY_ACC=CAM_ASM_000205 /LENGTH=393 /DNA_ID=CAMNT_0025052341 /DNA_START=76 /DNA_END=1257 /DNA_ORIENTATION=-
MEAVSDGTVSRMEGDWLSEWSPEWSPTEEVDLGSFISPSPSSDSSFLSEEYGLFAEGTDVTTATLEKPSPLVPDDTVDEAVPAPKLKTPRKMKRDSGASRRRGGSPKLANRKAAPTGKAAEGKTASANKAVCGKPAATHATAAVRSGSFFDILTEEEREMMEAEGITVPKNGPLSKATERELKRLRRQVKNKYSAKDSRKKRKEYMDGLEQANADLSDQLSASQRENATLRSKLRSVQSLFRPACKRSTSLASKSRKSAMLLLALLFTRQQQGGVVDLSSVAGLSALVSSGAAEVFGDLDGWSTDEGTGSPVEEDEELPSWMTKGIEEGAPDALSLSEGQSRGVLDAARRAAADFLKKPGCESLAPAPPAVAAPLGMPVDTPVTWAAKDAAVV